jgi:hypothetical protein
VSENPKVTSAHRRRAAIVYVRQSSLAQLERNRESTTRQYDLVGKAVALGWPRSAVQVVDEDQGVSGSSAAGRSGFAQLAAQVGLGQVGIVLALEVSRLARNNADWYRLLDLAGMTDTLIADADGLYHPGLFNDRLVLGMKGTCPRPNCISCGPAWTAGCVTRPPAGSSSAPCRSAWSGVRGRPRSASTPTRRSPA